MQVDEAIRARRSIRKYRPCEIPETDMNRLLEAGMLAPSARNTRSWEFCVVTNRKILEKFTEIHPYAKHATSAAAVIFVCGREDLDPNYWVQNCAAVTQNILLEAVGLGYGACWCGIYPREERVTGMKEILGVESTPFCAITLGLADEAPKARGSFEPERVRYYR